MKQLIGVVLVMAFLTETAKAEEATVWQLVTEDGQHLTDICYEPEQGDQYIASDNRQYEVIAVQDEQVVVTQAGMAPLPDVDWLDADTALPVAAISKRIAMYCTHSDESYEPSDGTYSTTERGSIYQVADALANALADHGIDSTVANVLHHPHDAGAYRRSRQTAVQLLGEGLPDALIDIHRDGIPDPDSYRVEIAGKPASKIRLLVGRGNQNADVNKEFALMIKAVADRVYPGLIKDIYMGKGIFNQDLLPHSILFECGTYTLEKERVLASMPLMADVLDRALYGGVTGSAGRVVSDIKPPQAIGGDIVQGVPDPLVDNRRGVGSGFMYLGAILLIGIVGISVLSTGSLKRGSRKAGRNLSEMTGGLIGKPPQEGEEHDHS